MIAIRLSVPVACWRKGLARWFFETHHIPPPSTCYGALLSLVGEEDRERHIGCRVAPAIVSEGEKSVVLRTLWKVEHLPSLPGNKPNACPDFQELIVGSELLIFCDSREENLPAPQQLEQRVSMAFKDPASLRRYGGWSLGESTHLINDAYLLPEGSPLPENAEAFLLDPNGPLSMPVWVDHVGSALTAYVTGKTEPIHSWPDVGRLPRIAPP
jgi:CRISPR-associated protein Cas5t